MNDLDEIKNILSENGIDNINSISDKTFKSYVLVGKNKLKIESLSSLFIFYLPQLLLL